MNRNVTILLVAIIVLSLAIYFSAGRPSGQTDPQLGKRVLPELKENLSKVVAAEVKSASGDVKLERKEGSWVVANRDGYPVDFSRLSGLLDGIADAKFSERKTAKPGNFGELGLRAVSDEGSKAALVTIDLADGDQYQLLVGNSAGSARKGTYIRLPDRNQAWLTGSEIKPASDVAGWLAPTIINIDSSRIDKVTMRAVSGESITVARAEDPTGNFKLLDIPAGKKLRYDSIANTLARALSNVRLKDVAPAAGFDWSGSGSAEFHCTDGLVVDVKSKSKEGRYYLAFAASAEESAVTGENSGQDAAAAPAQEPAQSEQAGTETESAATGTERPTAAAADSEKEKAAEKKKSPAKEATELTEQLHPWVFEVTQYTYGLFTKTMADLTEADKKPEQPGEKKAAASSP